MSELTPECVKFYDVKYHEYVFIPKESCRLEMHETSRGTKARLTGEYVHPEHGILRTVSKFVSVDFKL